MDRQANRPTIVTLIAIFQFIPVLLLPPETLLSVNPWLLLVPLVLFLFLAWAMLTLRPWALTLCIFVQGFSLIARFLIMFPSIVSEEGVLDLPFLISSLGSIILSSVILYLVDKPDVHIAFNA